MSEQNGDYLYQLRYLLDQHLAPGGLKGLCQDLQIDYDALPGNTRLLKLNGLIQLYARAGRLESLVHQLRQKESDVDWPELPPAEQQIQDQQRAIPQEEDGEATLQRFFAELQELRQSNRLGDAGTDSRLPRYLSRLTGETLLSLDPPRKAELVRFLYDANLIVGQSPKISLKGATLNYVDFGWLKLPEINLSGASLFRADLSLCNLRAAHLSGANLRQATLKALLTGADLVGADLREASLSRAKLIGANLTGANLRVADLSGADMSQAILKGADLSLANLSLANLTSADLSLARLKDVNLTGTNLTGATLDQVNLSTAFVAETQLQQASSMRDAIILSSHSQPIG